MSKNTRTKLVQFETVRYVTPSALPTKPLQVAAKKVYRYYRDTYLPDELTPLDWFVSWDYLELFFGVDGRTPTNFESNLIEWLKVNKCSLYLFEW